MKVVVIVQARMGSTRLPGKVLLQLQDKPVLSHVIDRCKAIPLADEVVIATTDKSSDDGIESLCAEEGVSCYRGSEQDVMSRYYEAATLHKADVVVRITSDCPLIDPNISNGVIKEFLDHPGTDYCGNWMVPHLPVGLSIEVFSYEALKKANVEAVDPFEREHVTPYLHDHPELYSIRQVTYPYEYSMYRWTLDTPEDWKLIKEMYARLYRPGQLFSWMEGIQLMKEKPELALINTSKLLS